MSMKPGELEGQPLLPIKEYAEHWDITLPPGGSQAGQAQAAETASEVSRFESAVQNAGLQAPEEFDLERLLREAGVDVDDPNVQAWIRTVPTDLPAETLQFYIAQLAGRYPAVPVTQYSQALEASGFGQWVEPDAPIPTGYLNKPGMTPESFNKATGTNFSQNPDTGWLMFRNGVLVNPADGSVFFQPSSNAPGSPNWIEGVKSWTPEQIATWRSRLVEYGYLTKEQGKVKVVDQAFLEGLRAYHTSRYQHFGTAIPTDLAAIGGAGGAPKFNLTARDFQVQIRNDVREQFRSTFGNDPSDSELASWTRFVTQSAIRAQKALEHKGASPSSALSLAATNAEEALIERLQGSPEATLMRDSFEENTRLRDALQSAVITTRALAT